MSTFEANGNPPRLGPRPSQEGSPKQVSTVYTDIIGVATGMETIPEFEVAVMDGSDPPFVLTFILRGEKVSFVLPTEGKERMVQLLTGGIVLPG